MHSRESTLIESAKKGNPKAFDELVNEHRDRVYGSLTKPAATRKRLKMYKGTIHNKEKST
jgi:hypothetical protein